MPEVSIAMQLEKHFLACTWQNKNLTIGSIVHCKRPLEEY
jgi:hypothetical protein